MRELLARCDSRELTEWMAFEHIEPWGQQVEEWRFARLMALVANVNRGSKNDPVAKPEDFMPDLDGAIKRGRRPRQLSLEESVALGKGTLPR